MPTGGRRTAERRAAAAIATILLVASAARAAAVASFPEPSPAAEPATVSLEYQVKAAFLYNFAKFVEWPAGTFRDASSPLTIVVAGEDPFGEALERTVAGKTVEGRPFRIRRVGALARVGSLDDLESCQILFIARSEARRDDLDAILLSLRRLPILVVGDSARFARQGGTISFFTEESKVRFEINVETTEASGLKLSSKLLGLARVVKGAARKAED